MGLSSRDGIAPLNLGRDIGGPMARTVADATILLNVIAGYDPADTVTALSQGRLPDDYTVFLDPTSIQGKRLGVLRQLFQQPDSQPNGPEPSIPQLTQDQESQTSPATKVHPEVLRLMDQALLDLASAGAWRLWATRGLASEPPADAVAGGGRRGGRQQRRCGGSPGQSGGRG